MLAYVTANVWFRLIEDIFLVSFASRTEQFKPVEVKETEDMLVESAIVWVLSNAHECIHNSMETQLKCILFHLEKYRERKRKTKPRVKQSMNCLC